MNYLNSIRPVYLTLLLAFAAGSVQAGLIIKANNATALNATGSWVGGVVPGAGDTAKWDSTVTAANAPALGGSLTLGQILIANPGGAVTIASTASTTLTLNGLGSPLTGIDMSSATTNFSIAEPIALGASQTWNIGASRALTVSGVISGSTFGITQAGAGTLTLSGANTFTGPISLTGGTLSVPNMNTVANANPLGKSTTAASNLLLGNGTTLQIVGSGSTTRTTDRLFTINGTAAGDSATLDFSNNGSTAFGNGPATFTGTGALAYGVANQTRTLNLTGTCTFAGSLAAAIGDNGTGAVSVTKNGPGVVALTGNNTYTGGATVNAGVLSIGKTQAQGAGTVTATATGAVALGVGTGGYTTANVDSLIANTLTGFSLDPAAGAGIDTSIGAVSYSLPNTGTRPFVKVGGSALTLNGSSTYGGSVTVYNGTLAVTNLANGGSASPLGASSSAATNLVLNGGTFQFTGSANASTDRGFTICNNGAVLDASGTGTAGITWNGSPAYDVTNVARTLNLVGANAGGTNIFSGTITDNGTGMLTLNKSGAGTWWVSGTNSFTGGVSFNQGFLLFSTNSLGTAGTIQIGANSVPPLGLVWAPGNYEDISSRFTGTGSSGYCTLDTDTNDVVFGSAIAMHANSWLIKTGVGSLTLNAASTWGNSVNGATLINAGTLVANVLANGGTASSIGNIPNTAVAFGLRGGTLKYIGTGSTNDHNFQLAGNNTIDASGTGPLVFSQTGVISPTPAARTFGLTAGSPKTGNAPQNSSDLAPGMAVSVTTGPGVLPAGTKIVSIGINGQIIFDQNATTGGNATLAFGAYPGGTLTLAGTNTGANEIKGVLQDSTSTLDTNTLSVVKSGVGQWILSGANTYSGPTFVSNGTLTINGSLAPASAVTLAGGTLAGKGTIQGVVTNNGLIAPGGANTIGTVTLTNLLTGNGALVFDLTNANTAGVTYDQINGGGTLQLALSGPMTIQLNALTGTLTNGNYYLITNTASLTGGSFVLTNGLTVQTNNATVLTLINSSTGLILNVAANNTPPTQLAFTSAPANPQTGVSFNISVTAQDGNGIARVVSSDTTVTLSRTAGVGTLSGTLSGVIASNSSSVTFSALAYDTAETMTLTATSTAGMSLTAANTNLTFTPVPTKLAITSVNGGSNPYALTPFSVVVQAQDGASTARNVVSNTVVSLSVNTGSGTLNTPLTGTILAGANSVTLGNVIYSQPETNVSLTATRTSGDVLTAGNSAAFNVLTNVAKNILTFTFPGYGDATITGTNITMTLPPYTVVTSLAPTYTSSVGTTGSPVSGTARNFTTPQTYIITAQDNSQQAYQVTVSLMAANAFSWTNTVSGNWSGAGNWTNNFSWTGAPTNTGDATYALNFNQAGTYTASNDLNNGFLLNVLNFGGPTLTLVGNSLAFTNNGIALPQINQNSASGININNNFTLATNTTLGGSGNGAISLNGVISGAGSLTMANSGVLTLNGTNTYTGGTVISAGTVVVVAAPPFNATIGLAGSQNVTLQSGATLQGNRANFSGTLTVNGGTWTEANGFGGSWTGSIILNSNLITSSPFAQVLNGVVSGPGGLIHNGTGGLYVSFSNTFTGPIAVNAGNLFTASFNSVVGGKPTSNLGAPINAAGGTISLGSTTSGGSVTYTGSGETTDRILQLAGTTGGATIIQQGYPAGLPITQTGQSGLLKFTSDLSVPGVAGQDNRKTLTLTSAEVGAGVGFVCGQGEISGSIGDSVLGNSGQKATSVTKAGYGVWTLSGANTYSGTTTVQAGKLICKGATALGSGPLVITDADVIAKLELDFVGLRPVAALTINGVVQPNGIYGSSSSLATTKDDVHFVGSGAVVVGSLATATTNTLALTSGSNPSAGGAALTFTASVTGGNSPSGSVVFYDGLNVLGTNALNGSAQTSLSTSTLTGGTHSITALYLGNTSNAPSASPAVTQIVNDSRPATTTVLALTAGNNPSSLGAAVTYTATVTGATPTGTVVFYNGTSAIGSSALSAGQASLVVNNLPSGWDGITANYLGDANNAPSTSAVTWQTVKPPAGNGKLKVFILAGQSNMQGKGQVELGRDPNNLYGASIVGGLGTMRNMLNLNPNQFGYLVDTNSYANTTNTTVPGWRTLTNVWVSYFTSGSTASAIEARKGYLDADFGDGSSNGRIGPEYGFGLVVGSQLGDPVLIIKTAWGGNSLAWNFRPPSSGTNNVTPVGINTLGDAYSNMVANVHYILNNLTNELSNFSYNPAAGYEIAGFGWHQGWNDIGEPEAEYETNLVNLIHDLRAEFGVPNMPFVIDNIGMSSASGSQLLICAAQAAAANPVLHPELAGTVFTVDTRPYDYGYLLGVNNQGYHWYFNGQSQFQIGQSMGLGMMQLLSNKAGVTNTPAGSVTTNAAALNATVTWPFTSANGVVYWDTTDHGTNAGAWPNRALVNTWANTTPTNSYGVAGDYILAGGPLVTVAATNLSYTATGLAPNTTYYYTYAATNQTVNDLSLTNVQTLWATNTQSFTTLTVTMGPPPTPLLPGNAITVSGGGPPTFTFNTVAGYLYRLVFKNALTDATWSPVIAPPNFPAPNGWSAVSTGSPMSLSDTNAVGHSQRFYRIEAANPP